MWPPVSAKRLLDAAIAELAGNAEQLAAVQERGHCVVLAGPGSGKTKTLTAAMARALHDEIAEPRGVACLTYNNECAIELENRLAKLGIAPSDRVFIGTVHSFALSHIIAPYARCVLPELHAPFRLATVAECRQAVEEAYKKTIGGFDNPHDRWKFAATKRRRDVDRSSAPWRNRNPELTSFIVAYEGILRSRGLIDFDDMPLLAARMVHEHAWIQKALEAKFPVLFVDEYQDLGHALHELVLTLCFSGNIRLFAVGDPDQSIYAFTGANPELLISLQRRPGVRVIPLRLNYRCGTKIIAASRAALSEDRLYEAPTGTPEGIVSFHNVPGASAEQANFLVSELVPRLRERGVPLDQIGVLYRTADQGDVVAAAALAAGYPVVRADNQALVRRNSRLARFVEGCARWVSGGWRDADPQFGRLCDQAVAIVFGNTASYEERQVIALDLISFLTSSVDVGHTSHTWLQVARRDLVAPWRARARTIGEDWDAVDEMVTRTDAGSTPGDIPLAHFGGRIDGVGRLNLSTLHSAKGREFDAVVLFEMNNDVIPKWQELNRPESLREVRRLFYVGVTRARRELHLLFTHGRHSPWVKELYDRLPNSP